MVKASALSSDIDVIKEFEELKLKQKLLIESLKRNSDSQQNKLFLEINSKLDFLVKIFTEANNSDEEETKIDFETKFNEVLDKLNSLSQNVDDKFSQIESKIGDIKIPEIEIPKTDILENPVSEIKSEINVGDNSKENEKLNLPPAPEFETKISEISDSQEVEKKKKKWF